MDSYRRLLLNNRAWMQEKLSLTPEYFEELANRQDPHYLWIGCSDSRVPANEVTGTQPGEIYVHRNVGNLIIEDDINMLSAVQYAVEVLNVKHIIVCGHYDCGGIQIALDTKDYGYLDTWLKSVKNVYEKNKEELNKLPDSEKADRLVELNIKEQVQNLSEIDVIQKHWENNSGPYLHGWVYDIHKGSLKDLIIIENS